jgi:hypothetical protein
MNNVVSVLGSEARKNNPSLVSLTVSIGILEKKNIVAVGYIYSPVSR